MIPGARSKARSAARGPTQTKGVTGRAGNPSSFCELPSVATPVKFVWALAEEMTTANPQVRRKDIVDARIAKGVAFYTAKT